MRRLARSLVASLAPVCLPSRGWGRQLSLGTLLLLLVVPAVAQRFTAAIRGQVTDPSRAVIAGAKVTLKNEGTGLGRTATTNEAGYYSFPYLPVGSYQVEVAIAGFKTEVRTRIVINVATCAR